MSTFVIPGLEGPQSEQLVIEFGTSEKTLFSLPVLGQSGVPLGVVTGAMMLSRALDLPDGPDRNGEVSRAWAFFVDVLATSYPTATRHIASLDFENVQHVLTHWFDKSKELGGFDPKVSPSSPS